jgi:hypothetical protein
MRSRRVHAPRPTVAEPRPLLLAAVLTFVKAAAGIAGVQRIALIGSLTTDKGVPHDADVLVTIDADMDLAPLARLSRGLKGRCQHINLGADIFLADSADRYLGRICGYRECFRRVLCRAENCGLRQHLNDDLHVITLSPDLIAAPAVELWPRVLRRVHLPSDVEAVLLHDLEQPVPPA